MLRNKLLPKQRNAFYEECSKTLANGSCPGWHNDVVIMKKKDTPVVCIDQQGGKGNANYSIDVACPILSDSHGTPRAVAYAVDVRNGVVDPDTSGTLQSKPNGGISINMNNVVLVLNDMGGQ